MEDPYSHWNEEAPIVKERETDYESPYCDMTDAEIKQAVHDKFNDPEFDMDHDEW
jgi:hypothetical protein